MRLIIALSVLISFTSMGQTFTDIAAAQNVTSVQYAPQHYANGMSFYDFDEDGWDDLTYPMNNDSIAFYRNVNGNFVQIPSMVYAPGAVRQMCWVDYDDDGDLDFCVTFDDIGIRLYQNDGAFNMTEVTDAANLAITPFTGYGFSFADPDADGDLDLYVAIYESSASTTSPIPNLFYENLGNGTFQEVSAAWGIDDGLNTSFQPVWFDFDNDLDLDLHLINDRPAHVDAFYVNDGSTVLTNQASTMGILNQWMSPMSLSVADYDNDGYQDIFKTDIATGLPFNGIYDYYKLFRNQNGSFFQDVAGPLGLETINFGWGSVWVDYNNDGYEDLYVATGDIDSLLTVKTSLLFKNDGGTGFVNETDSILSNVYNVAYCPVKGDIDNDGFYDLVVVNHGIAPSVLSNSGNKNHYIKVTPVGIQSNKQAIGTVFKVYAGGMCQTQTVFCGSDLCAQHSQHKIFGTGNALIVDSLVAYFPSGIVTKMYNLPVDSSYVVEEKVTIGLNFFPGQGAVTVCDGDSAEIGVPGLYNYQWNTGETTSHITVTSSGTYSFEAENATGDTLYISDPEFVYFEPSLNAISIVTQPPCGDDSSGVIQLLPTQSQLVDSILWSNGELGNMIDSLSPGMYTYTLVSINGCLSTDSVEIVGTPSFNVQPFTTSVTDQSLGSVTFNIWGGSAPFEFYMDTAQVGQTINNLAAGTYEVTVIDAAGCEVIVSFTINDESSASLSELNENELNAFFSDGTCFLCAEKSLTGSTISIIDMTGKEVLNWTWTESDACTQRSSNLTEGFYQVQITHQGITSVNNVIVR